MEWSDNERQKLAAEYTRIAHMSGEHWPAPPPDPDTPHLLGLFAQISDGAGRQGYIDILAKQPKKCG